MILGPAQVLPIATTTSDVDVYEGAAILHGWAWRETTDAARTEFELRDGSGGPLIVPVTLSAGQSTRDWLSGTGILVRTGLYLRVLSGSVSASLWFRPVNDANQHGPIDVRQLIDELVETLWVR